MDWANGKINKLEIDKFSGLNDVAEAIYERDGYLLFPWSIEDIRQAWAIRYDVEPEDCPLDDEQCWDVLRMIKRGFDATIGVDWDVIECYLDRIRISFFRVPILPCCGEPDE